jgi:hypothetical protein
MRMKTPKSNHDILPFIPLEDHESGATHNEQVFNNAFGYPCCQILEKVSSPSAASLAAGRQTYHPWVSDEESGVEVEPATG